MREEGTELRGWSKFTLKERWVSLEGRKSTDWLKKPSLMSRWVREEGRESIGRLKLWEKERCLREGGIKKLLLLMGPKVNRVMEEGRGGIGNSKRFPKLKWIN